MGEGFKIKIFPNAIRALSRAQIIALEKTGEAIRSDVVDKQVIPFDKGKLQNEQTNLDTSMSKLGVVKITHSTPYARRLYYHPEYKFSKAENPNARGRWWEPWLNGDRKDYAKKAYKRFMKGAANGYIK